MPLSSISGSSGGGGGDGGGTVLPILTSSQPSSPASPDTTAKKPRRSQRIKGAPIEDDEETTKGLANTTPQTTPRDDPVDVTRTPASSQPPHDNTQVASQFYYPPLAEGLDGEEDDENVWGYLWPLDGKSIEVIKLDKQAPPPSTPEKKKKRGSTPKTKKKPLPPNGFIVGRHAECDLLIDDPVISNRHCVIFKVSPQTSMSWLVFAEAYFIGLLPRNRNSPALNPSL